MSAERAIAREVGTAPALLFPLQGPSGGEGEEKEKMGEGEGRKNAPWICISFAPISGATATGRSFLDPLRHQGRCRSGLVIPNSLIATLIPLVNAKLTISGAGCTGEPGGRRGARRVFDRANVSDLVGHAWRDDVGFRPTEGRVSTSRRSSQRAAHRCPHRHSRVQR